MRIKWKRYGPSALLFQFADQLGDETFARGCALAAHLERDPPPGMVEYVPAFTTVLLEFDAQRVPDPSALAPGIAAQLASAIAAERPLPRLKEIPVVYDGPDLARVAELHGLTPADVAALHASRTYKVYLLGFSPGFPYLGDLDPRLHTPRLPSPRTHVAAGAVAIGGEHTGIYTVDGPGGWNVIGRTPLSLFDPARALTSEHPRDLFFLHHGDLVKFAPVATESRNS